MVRKSKKREDKQHDTVQWKMDRLERKTRKLKRISSIDNTIIPSVDASITFIPALNFIF